MIVYAGDPILQGLNTARYRVAEWRKTRHQGRRKPLAFYVPNKDLPAVPMTRQENIDAYKAQRFKRKDSEYGTKYEIAEMLDMHPNSITVRRLYYSKITLKDAKRISREIQYRHNNTNYEELLDRGYSQRAARRLMTEKDIP